MNNDTNPLQERIAAAWNGLTPEEWAALDHEKHGPGLKRLALRDAAAVLPLIAAEVREGQARALRETADWWAANPDDEAFETPGDTRNWMRDTATEYEQET